MNACNEVFYYDSSSWIMIAGQTGYTPADRSRRRLRDDLDEDHDGLGRPIDRPDGMVDGVVVHDATLWALLTDHRTVRRFDPITILWTDGVVAESDLSGVAGVDANNYLALLSNDSKLVTVDTAARSWQVKLDLNACSATHDDQGYLWYSTRTSTKNADVSCNTLTVCPPQVQQTTDLEKCQQVYGGSVQSFAVNAHGGGAMVEIWIVDAQGQVYYDTVAQANRTAAPPSPLPVDALLSSSPTPGTSLSPDTPAATPPGPVGSAALSQHGNAVVVSFTAPANSGSSPITDFVVTAVPATGTPGSPPNVTITGSSSPVVLHGLQDQVLYTVHISAESAAGASADVQVGPAFTYHMATPGAPSNLTVTATGVVTFAPTTAGASTIDGYRVLAVPACGGANVTVSGHSSPLQLSGLVNGQTYTVTVISHNRYGISLESSSVALNARTAPSEPTNLAVSKVGLITFTPPLNSGASSIDAYQAVAVPGNGGANITASGSSSPLQLGGLADGATYTVYLFAVNLNGTSPALNPIVFTATLTPACPTDITVSSTGLVSFNTAVSLGASPITGYTVTAVPDNGGAPIVVQGSSSPLQVAGLQSGMGYTATLVASNANGTSPVSDPVVFTAPILTSDAPTDIAVSSSGLVSFTPPVNSGASAITGYTVTAVSANGGAAITVQGSSSPLQLAGVQAGTSYTISLVATNANGDSPPAGPVAFTAPVLTPDPPMNVAVSSSGLVSFTNPINGGASPISGYTVTAVPASGGAAITVQGSCSPLQLAGLQAGSSYTISLVATNANGDSPAAGPVAFVPPPAPDPPTNIAVTPAGLVSFTPPVSGGASTITGYSVTAVPSNGGTTITVQGSSSPLQLAGLQNGASYTVTILATNVDGSSPASPPVAFIATLTPDPPTNVAADVTGLISFSAPFNNGATPIDLYTVTAVPANGGASLTTSGTSSPLQLGGVVAGQTYSVTITCHNVYGTSPASNAATFVATGVPDEPTSISISSSPVGLVTFSAPADSGASPITGYIVRAIPSTNGAATITVQGSSSPLQLTGLVDRESYMITVVATNTYGNSPAAGPVAFTPAFAPGPPTNVAASTTGLVTFSAPSSTGASPITSYTATATTGSGTPISMQGIASPLQLGGLQTGSSYSVTIVTTNAQGNSQASSPVTFTAATPTLTPGPPTNIAASSTGLISFSAPASTGASPITGYTATAIPSNGGNPMSVQGNASPLQLGGLQNGASYSGTVVATNAQGNSQASSPFTFTASLVPGPPTLVTASPTGLISFTPGSPGASPITGYIVSAAATNGATTITVQGTSSPLQLGGLQNGASYSVTAIAKNIIGNSAVSGAAAFTASLAPGPPANVIGFPNGTCVFTRPTSTGFTAITGYTITAVPAAGSPVGAVSATFTATSTATTKELGGLLQGASYTLSVTVQNTNGSSVPGVSPAFTYTGNGHGFLDSRIIYPPAHITGTTAGSSNVVAATLACSVGFSARRQSGTSTVLSEAIRGPQMFYAFQETAATVRKINTCGCAFDTVLLVYSSTLPPNQLGSNPLSSGSLSYMLCDDDDGDTFSGPTATCTPDATNSNGCKGCVGVSVYDSPKWNPATVTSGRNSFATFTTIVGRWYYVVIGDYSGSTSGRTFYFNAY